MRRLLAIAWLVVLLGPSRPASGAPATDPSPPSPAANQEAVEVRYQKLLEMDDAALAEVDRWIREEQAQRTEATAITGVTLRAHIQERLRPVRGAYENFLRDHPDHARARLAYGSFLSEIGDEAAAVVEMEKARELDPSNPAAWNNLANYYGHRGPVSKAFDYYAKAIELNPSEAVYYQNLATAVYVFRKDAREFYQLDEAAVFEKSLQLYRQAMELDPTNFVLATEYAQSFYGMLAQTNSPARTRSEQNREVADRAIPAWLDALRLAGDEIQRQGTLLHLARNRLLANRFAEARADLAAVTNEVYLDLKARLLRNLENKENPAPSSEALPASHVP